MDYPDKITDSSKWYIGITYTTESSKNFENFTVATWCKPDMDKCVLSAPQNNGWFIFNIQSTGNLISTIQKNGTQFIFIILTLYFKGFTGLTTILTIGRY